MSLTIIIKMSVKKKVELVAVGGLIALGVLAIWSNVVYGTGLMEILQMLKKGG